MNARAIPFPWRFLAFLLLLTTCALLFSRWGRAPQDADTPSNASHTERIRAVVLDAGHGGEDGGAVGGNGIAEKSLNLKITLLLRDLLEANGIRVVLTREKDELLYDKSTDYHGRKKVLDLAARRAIAEAHPDAVFVSIHMNTYPLESCRGLQVWYSANDARSALLAESIRQSAVSVLDPDNGRQTKRAGSSIYLLHKIETPAVLVECGFLSNAEEAELLSTEEYQRAVALSVFLAIVQTEFQATDA